jgi:DNA adenine methylase
MLAAIDPYFALSSLKPPLKWAGGKRWLIPRLQELWRPYRGRRMVEPLCGGLAVALGLAPRECLLNDINPHPINFYTHLKRGLNISMPMRNEAAQYYDYRRRFNELIGNGEEWTPEAAALFYYLNRTGYNGLCRFNRKGEFNVPFGRYSQINYTREFSAYARAFARWDFRVGDFAALPLRNGDFVYADPPYDVEFTSYSKERFGWSEQIRLAEWLAAHDGPVVLSNQATERVIALYKRLGFRLAFLNAPRRISCTGDRTPALEVLATKGA